ncbi:MAG: YbjQ family protein [Candidatus Bathyarchaeia archaeon]
MSKSNFVVVTTPTVAGYKIKKVLGLVTGLAPRTRGVGGVFKAGLQSLRGGEITAFTSEIEKARVQAIERAIEKAKKIGANAIIGMDLETSDIGQTNVTLISATGTAVIIEPE